MSIATTAVADNGSIYVRVGAGGLIQTSPDGESWTIRASGVTSDLHGVVWWVTGVFIVVGKTGTVLTSADGITWVVQTSSTTEHIYAVDANLDVVVACGANGLVTISIDGIAWSAETDTETTKTLWGISAGAGQYIAVGEDSTIVIGSIFSDDDSRTIIESFIPSNVLSATGAYHHTFSEGISLVDGTINKFFAFVYDTMQMSNVQTSSASFNKLVSDSITLYLERALITNEHINESFTLGDTLTKSMLAVLLESIAMSDTIVTAQTLAVYLNDSVAIADTELGSLTATVILGDSFSMSDEELISRSMLVAIQEGFNFGIALDFEGVEYEGWAMNLSNMAITKYTGFNFNSMGQSNGITLGADENGIYSLDGDTDDGDPISAFATFKVDDFGSRHQSRVPEVFVGIRKNGKMVLKVTTNEKDTQWYEMKSVHEGMGIERIKTHKGIKAGAWQFTLANKGGSDFDIDFVEVIPLILQRKTR